MPFVNVPYEVINQWEDWVHRDPRLGVQLSDAMSDDEVDGMATYHRVWSVVADVVQRQCFNAFGDRPSMIGDHLRAVEHLDAFSTQTDVKLASRVTNGHRVETLADTNPGLGVDPAVEQQPAIERVDR